MFVRVSTLQGHHQASIRTSKRCRSHLLEISSRCNFKILW